MTQHREASLRQVLREAAKGSLEEAWIYLRDSADVGLESECFILGDVEELHEYATSLEFPQEGLDSASIEDCAQWAKLHEITPSDELLFYAFRYYWLFDAFPAYPWAPDPPPPHEAKHLLALSFYRSLGEERRDAVLYGAGRKAVSMVRSSTAFCAGAIITRWFERSLARLRVTFNMQMNTDSFAAGYPTR